MSPLATREARDACGVPVYTAAELRDPRTAAQIVGLERADPSEPESVPHLTIVDDRAAS
jgi:hypothetical protein